jgi:hypothetical protein
MGNQYHILVQRFSSQVPNLPNLTYQNVLKWIDKTFYASKNDLKEPFQLIN